MLTMKRSDDSTHPCRSPTPTVNGRDVTLPTRTQTSEQKYRDLMANNRRPSAPYSRNTPQSFSQGTRPFCDVFQNVSKVASWFLHSKFEYVTCRATPSLDFPDYFFPYCLPYSVGS